MQTPMKILLSAGFAAASMYYLDPSRGKDRRADARARFENGTDAVAQGIRSAGNNLDSDYARVTGRKLSRGLGKLNHDAGNLAAGAVGTVASFLNRNLPRGKAHAGLRAAPRAKFLLIPGTWIATAGLGAATMYYFDSAQGQSRRAHLYARLAGWRDTAKEKFAPIVNKLPGKAEKSAEQAEEISDQTRGRGFADGLREQDPTQDRPLRGDGKSTLRRKNPLRDGEELHEQSDTGQPTPAYHQTTNHRTL